MKNKTGKYNFPWWRIAVSRSLIVIWGSLHIFVFLGVVWAGVLSIWRPVIFSDALYGTLYITLGAIFGGITLSEIKRMWYYELYAYVRSYYHAQKKVVILTTIIFLGLFILQAQLGSMLLYIGHALGIMVLQIARGAYRALLGIDIFDFGWRYFAWIFQWYVVLWVVQLCMKTIKKFYKH